MNVNKAFKPVLQAGCTWLERHCDVEPGDSGGKNKEIKAGDQVKLTSKYKDIEDAESGPLKPGQIGKVTYADGYEFCVEAPDGGAWYYFDGAIKLAKDIDTMDMGIPNPFDDGFEGLTFTRFPVTTGDWYAEVSVLKVGESRPMVGWAVLEEGEAGMKLLQMAVVDGVATKKVDWSFEKIEARKKRKEEKEKKAKEAEEKAKLEAEKAKKEAEEKAKKEKEAEEKAKKEKESEKKEETSESSKTEVEKKEDGKPEDKTDNDGTKDSEKKEDEKKESEEGEKQETEKEDNGEKKEDNGER